MKYLIETTEVYRVDNEDEAKVVVEEAKKSSTVSKYNCVYKSKKQKGEIVDEWYKVSITKKWDDEKDPCGATQVHYGVVSAWEDCDRAD